MLCIPLHAHSEKELYSLIKKAAKKKPDLLEIWLDDLKNPDIRRIIELAECPTIFVNRKNPTVEQFQEVIEENSAFIDLDIRTSKNIIKKIAPQERRTKLIISYHDYEKTPSQEVLGEIVNGIFKLGADVAKVATQVQKDEDEKVLLAILKKYKLHKKKIIIHGMGEKSQKSRLECYKNGSEIAYVALDKNHKTAPGQITIDQWRATLR